MTLMKLIQRVGRVARTRSIGFQRVDAIFRLTIQRQMQHSNAVIECTEHYIKLMRGPGGWNKPHFIQLRLFAALFRQDEVAEMNGVE